LVSDPKAAEDFVAAVKAYNEAIVALHAEIAEAYFANEAALKVRNEANTEYNTLNAVYNGNKNNQYNYVTLYDLLYNNQIESQGFVQYGYWTNGYVDQDMLHNITVALRKQGIGLDGALAIDNMIKALEDAIENIEEEIEELKDVTSMEQALEIAKVQLDNKKNYQVALKAELDYVKAELDALQAKLIATEEEAA
jgi:MinD-like ATPase involved in chromosome partitioning or flagellar assembly